MVRVTRAILGTVLAVSAGRLAFGQSTEPRLKFEIADVHVGEKVTSPYVRRGPIVGGRYEVKNATMADLVGLAYGVDMEKVYGGPNWLELDRFDVIAKVPANSTTNARREMLRTLLADRFKLVAHPDTKPLPAWTLALGKKPQLKEAGGSEEPGCRPNADAPPSAGGPSGTSATVQYSCRNMSMAAFAEGLPTLPGTNLGAGPVADETGLKGKWNFDLRFSAQTGGPMMGSASDHIPLTDAIEKQLGLKLAQRPVPTPVIVVDSVNRTPTENPPGVAEALPTRTAPTEFEVASMKPSAPGIRIGQFHIQPGGRLNAQGELLRLLVNRAFDTSNNELVVGLPGFAETDRYDIVAKAPARGPDEAPLDFQTVVPMLRTLLAERCKMTYHTEDRQVSAYALVAAKPKMKKADPESRIFCRSGNAPAGTLAGGRMLTCQNVTMAQFAERLQRMAPELSWGVPDATGIEGGWDFTLTYASRFEIAMRTGMGGAPGPDEAPAAAEPSGANSLFEALEKQLGLRLEKQKRTVPVIVIDRFEKPTGN